MKVTDELCRKIVDRVRLAMNVTLVDWAFKWTVDEPAAFDGIRSLIEAESAKEPPTDADVVVAARECAAKAFEGYESTQSDALRRGDDNYFTVRVFNALVAGGFIHAIAGAAKRDHDEIVAAVIADRIAKQEPRELTDEEILKKNEDLWKNYDSSTFKKQRLSLVRWAIAESYPDFAKQAEELDAAKKRIEELKTSYERQLINNDATADNYLRVIADRDEHIADLMTCGVIELMRFNPNVASFVREKEKRIEEMEAVYERQKKRNLELCNLVSHWQSVLDDTDETEDWDFGDVRWRDRLAQRLREKDTRIAELENKLCHKIETVTSERIADLEKQLAEVEKPMREEIDRLKEEVKHNRDKRLQCEIDYSNRGVEIDRLKAELDAAKRHAVRVPTREECYQIVADYLKQHAACAPYRLEIAAQLLDPDGLENDDCTRAIRIAVDALLAAMQTEIKGGGDTGENRNSPVESKKDAPPPASILPPPIFSGEGSRQMWGAINKTDGVGYTALHVIARASQRLESVVREHIEREMEAKP